MIAQIAADIGVPFAEVARSMGAPEDPTQYGLVAAAAAAEGEAAPLDRAPVRTFTHATKAGESVDTLECTQTRAYTFTSPPEPGSKFYACNTWLAVGRCVRGAVVARAALLRRLHAACRAIYFGV